MDIREFITISKIVDEDAKTILQNQMVYASINSQLSRNSIFPFEQDSIYEEHFSSKPSEPKIHEYQGLKFTTRVLHQTGIRTSDIAGADLLYEIESQKFVLIQYKKATEGKVQPDLEQLQRLLQNCPENCRIKLRRPLPVHYLPIKTNAFCGTWYGIFYDDNEKRYVHACEAEAVFLSNSRTAGDFFKEGMSRNTFMELFSSCRIGALLSREQQINSLDQLIDALIKSQHLVFHIKQSQIKRSFLDK